MRFPLRKQAYIKACSRMQGALDGIFHEFIVSRFIFSSASQNGTAATTGLLNLADSELSELHA